MNLTEFGSAIRKARIDGRVTLAEMAQELGVTPAYLSGMEVGRKKIPDEWVVKIEEFFRKRNVVVGRLRDFARISNKSVSLEGFSPGQQALIAGFARRNMTEEQVTRFMKLLEKEVG